MSGNAVLWSSSALSHGLQTWVRIPASPKPRWKRWTTRTWDDDKKKPQTAKIGSSNQKTCFYCIKRSISQMYYFHFI